MKHGTYGQYTKGCRCDDCRAAKAEYQRDYLNRNPEQREKSRVATDRWIAANLERKRAKSREAMRRLRARRKTEEGR